MAQLSKKKTKFPKSDARYWIGAIEKRPGTSFYAIRIQFQGRREWFSTEKSEKSAAGTQAQRIYNFLRANGWDRAILKYKSSGDLRSDNPTFDEFFQAVREHATIENATLEIYFGKCRTLLAEIFKIPKPLSVHYAKGDEKKRWTQKVESLQIRKLKPQHIQRWKKKRIDAAPTPAATQQAQSTINTILRNSKSLFSHRIQKVLDGVFPEFPWVNAITECDFEKVRPRKYRSHLEDNGGIELLMVAAERELRPEIPEPDPRRLRESKASIRSATGKHQQYKILLLALGAGLRRKEIDTLRWQQLDFANNRIRIETNELTRTKSAESEGEIDVQPELMDQLRQYKPSATSDFVVEGRQIDSPYQNTYQYRCDRHFKNLIGWLRRRGIDDPKPIHTLRKEFGSEMIRVAGIYEASRQLRHSDIRTTTNHYAYKKNRATVELFTKDSPEEALRIVEP